MSDNIDQLVLRWTPEQRERAWAIVNDIAEDIDNGESRAVLRQALAIYADLLCDALQARACERTKALVDAMKELAETMKKVDERPEPTTDEERVKPQ